MVGLQAIDTDAMDGILDLDRGPAEPALLCGVERSCFTPVCSRPLEGSAMGVCGSEGANKDAMFCWLWDRCCCLSGWLNVDASRREEGLAAGAWLLYRIFQNWGSHLFHQSNTDK